MPFKATAQKKIIFQFYSQFYGIIEFLPCLLGPLGVPVFHLPYELFNLKIAACLSAHPSVSVHLFPLHQVCSLRPDICPGSLEFYPLRLKICSLWPDFCHNRPEICLVMPEICHYKLKSLHPGFKSSLSATNLHSYASNLPFPPSNERFYLPL